MTKPPKLAGPGVKKSKVHVFDDVVGFATGAVISNTLLNPSGS